VPSPTDVSRGDLSAWLLAQLRSEFLVGDAEAPDEGGWDQSPTSDSASYAAYSVLTPMPSGDISGPLADSSADWILPYRIDSFGISREQVEFQADRCRLLVRPTARLNLTLGNDSYRIQQVRTTSLGGVGRTDNTEPSEFSQSDIVAVYLSKEL